MSSLIESLPSHIKQAIEEFEMNNPVELNIGIMTVHSQEPQRVIILTPSPGVKGDIVIDIADLYSMIAALDHE